MVLESLKDNPKLSIIENESLKYVVGGSGAGSFQTRTEEKTIDGVTARRHYIVSYKSDSIENGVTCYDGMTEGWGSWYRV